MKELEYAVAVGEGTFPFHMLHHEQCFPNGDHSAGFMYGDEDEEKRMVILARYRQPGGRWAVGIWGNYGWTLDAGEGDMGFKTIEEVLVKTTDLFKDCKGA